MTEREMLEEAFNRAKQVLAKVEMEAAAYRPTEVPSRLVTELAEQRHKVAELQSRLSASRPPTNYYPYTRPPFSQPVPRNGPLLLVLIFIAGVASVIIIFLTTRSISVSDPIYDGAVQEVTTQAVPTVQPNSPVVVQGNAVTGLTIFRPQCQACHPSLGKVAGIGPKLTNSPNAGDPNYIRKNVRNGKGAMPAFPSDQISDTDLENLVAYILSIRTK